MLYGRYVCVCARVYVSAISKRRPDLFVYFVSPKGVRTHESSVRLSASA